MNINYYKQLKKDNRYMSDEIKTMLKALQKI